MNEETKTFTITTSPRLMKRIERFLALLHFNSGFGHSGMFGMSLDGDGCEKVKISDLEKTLEHEVDAIGGVGYHVEVATDQGYTGYFIDQNKESKWVVRQSASLYKNEELVKTIPSSKR